MFDGTKVEFEIFSPSLSNSISAQATATIDDAEVEFFDASFFDESGAGTRVVPVRFDIIGGQLHYDVLASSGRFTDVDDVTGFNGYKFTFDALTGNSALRIINADIIGGRNTLEVPEDNIDTTRDTVFINVDGLSYARGEDLSLQLGFKVTGTKKSDILEGDDGRDKIVGKSGDDLLWGNYGRDNLNGGAGKDTLDGGAQADVLKGGGGADFFVLRAGGGRDTVKDFDDGVDTILLRTAERSFDTLTIVEAGKDVVIATGEGAALLLRKTDIADIDITDFDFG